MNEEYGKEGPIKSIFLSEFHHIAGPKIVYQYPENYVTKEVFDAVSVFLIPKPQILKRIITVNVLGVKITGYPNEIKNENYARNALIFNLCFVCDSTARTVHYEPAVKKLSEYLENLEHENGFLSDEASRSQVPGMLKHVLQELNLAGKCTVTITVSSQRPSIVDSEQRRSGAERRPSLLCERRHQVGESKLYNEPDRRMSMFSDQRPADSSIRGYRKSSVSEAKVRRKSSDGETTSVLHLKVVGVWPDPPKVQDHHVPILISDRMFSRGDSWDLTTHQVLPYIDGFTHIAKIAAAADVENNLVKACVENLIYYEQVRLLPIFMYSNVYTVMPGLRNLYSSTDLQEQCRRAAAKTSHPLPQLAHILTFLCSMTYGVTVRDLCIRLNPGSLNIDERTLIQFALQHDLIRRLHCYPVLPPSSTISEDPLPLQRPGSRHSAILSMCTGQYCYDEICCKFGLTYRELNERMERDSRILILWK